MSEQAKELKGVSGWLGYYVWVGLIATPILILGVAMSFFQPDPAPDLSLFGQGPIGWGVKLFLLIVYAADFAARLMLLKGKPYGVRLIKSVLLILGVYNLIIAGLAFTIEGEVRAAYMMGGFVGAAMSAAWIAYFTRSKRVKNTYGV